MARALHIVNGRHVELVVAAIEQQKAAGDAITVVLLSGAEAPDVPAGVNVHRVPAEWSYERLLEAVFAADHVATW
jgi:hypothetical protein